MLSIIATVLFIVLTAYLYYRFSLARDPNFSKSAPPVITGKIPYLGDLQVFGPGLREYIDKNRRKYGDLFTVYVRGQFWTFIFGEENLRTFFTSSEKVISSFNFLYQMLEPMQPVSIKKMRAVNESLNLVYLSHKVLNKTEQLERMATNIEQVSKKMFEEVFGNATIVKEDVFKLTYKLVFYCNILNFGGEELYNQYRDEVFDLWCKIDYAKLNVPKEMLLRKLWKTESQKAFLRLQDLVEIVMKKRENQIGQIGDMLDSIMSHIRTRIIQNEMPSEITEVEANAMQLLNMFVASQITTSNTVAWLYIKIIESKDENLLKDLRNEAANAPSPITLDYLTNNMPITDAAIVEAVRFSLLGIGGRMLMEPVKFGKYIVPKGNILYHPYYGSARHFTDASTYDPYRYINREEHIDKEFKFTPFGAGRHPCAGQTVAKNLAKMLVIQLLNNTEKLKLVNKPIVAPTCLADFNRQVPVEPVIIELHKKK